MYLIYLAAFIAACGAAKLDRTYLPPPSAALAGGSPGSLQVPLTRAFDQASQNVPPGGFINDHQGVVVEAATAGTRASSQKSGLGGSRDSYGSTDSKVGAAAFRTPTHQSPNHMPNFESVHGGDLNPDLSAFYQPMTSYRPGNVQIIRDYVSNTIKYHNDIDINKFNYGFETNNGIKASESGVATNGVQVQGGYSYTGDDGRVYSVSYTADENGFRPHGSHLPTPPPIPIEILRSLEQNAKDEAAGNFDDGSYDAKKYNADGDYTKSDANGEYNDRQSNKFGKRPGSTDGIGTFNQNQQAYVTSNFNGQFGFIHDTSKDKFSGADDFNIMNNRNTFPKNELNNQFINGGLGSRNEYLPPNRGQFESMFSAGGNKDSFSISQPILQQKLQAQGQLNIVRPNSFEISPGIFSQVPFNSQISSLPSNNYNNQGSTSDFSDKNISPSIASQFNNKPLSENPVPSNILNQNPMIMQQSNLAPNNNKPIFTQDSISQSFASVSAYSPQTQSAQQFISTNSPLQSTQNLNIRLPTTQLSSAPSGSFNPSVMGQSQYTHIPVSSLDTSFSSTIPTVQPQKILTTPFETSKMREPSTLLDSGKAELLNATTASDFTVVNQNIRLPSTQLSSAPSVSFIPSVNTIGQPQYTHTSISSFDTSFSSVVPTVQPQITLSTPFEVPKTGEPSNLLDSEKNELLNATTASGFTVTKQNIHLPTTHLNSASSEYFNPSINTIGQTQYPNGPSFSTDTSFSSSSLSGVPTVQPQITLTTPFETPKRDPSTVLDSGKTELFKATTVPEFTVTENQSSKLLVQSSSNKEQLPTNDFSGFSTSSFDTRPQSTSQPFDKTQTIQLSDDSKPQVTQVIFVSNRQGDSDSTYTQGPTYNGQSNKFNGETQAPDQSYTYKQPSIPFNTPFVVQQSSNFPTGLSQVTQSLTTPQDSTSTTQYQIQSTLNNSPNPTTLIPNISLNTLKENELEKTTLQATNGITQASISPFPSTIFTDSSNFKIPLQQSELITPSQSAFPQSSTISVTATAEIVSTTSDDQKDNTQNQSFVEDKLNDGINKINNEQYSSEIYQHNKPDQGLPPQPQKEDDKFTIKTERPQFAVSSSQLGQEGSTISMDQNNIQRDTQKPQTTFEAQSDSPVSEQSFGTRFGEQTSTQVTQADLNSNEYTISQSQKHTSPGIGPNYKPTTFFPSTVPSNALNTDKLNSQTSTTLSDTPTFGPQFTSQFEGSGTKETTSSYFQQPNQQTETQFNYQPSTSISGASQTTPEIKDDTQLSQSTTQFGQEHFDNKATTLPQFQQTVTQFTNKPSTSISNVDHSTFSGFNTQNPDNQISFSTSFIPTSTEEPTQFGTQDNQGSFENKQTTIYHYQTPSHQSTTTYSEPSTLIPSTAQTETPPNQQTQTQLNYQPSTLISGASQTTPEIKDDTQLTSISQRFGTQSTTQLGQEFFDNKATTLPQFQQTVTQFTYKPSTSISNVDHSTFSGFNIQNPDNQNSFSTSFVTTSTEEPTQFGTQDNHGSFENKQTTIYHYQTPNYQSSTTFSEPSTLIPSAAQTETPPGTTQFGEIYDYKKPTESLIIPQNENNAQFGIQSNMGTQAIPIFQKENPIQFAQQTQQPQYNTQPSTQFNQKVTEKETTQSHMTQSEVVTGIEYNTGSTMVPSLPQFQTTSNTQVPDQTSTTGEIYDYTKPEQGLSPQSEGENGQLGQKIPEQQIGERTTIPVESTFETKLTTISQSTEAPTSTSATFQTQSSLNSQTTNAITSQSVFTQETLSETKPSDSPPQFSFYSACCKGSRNQGSISANEILNTQNKNMDQVADKNLVEEKQNLNVPVLQDAQKGSQTYAGIGEEFGGPRNPPSFDETGYHY